MTLLLFTGIRRGEACGLKWGDIDLETGVLKIRRALYYTKKSGFYFDSPKSNFSIRSIMISEILVSALQEYRTWQNSVLYLNEGASKPQDLIFLSTRGSFVRPDHFTKKYREFITSTDLPYSSLQSLRHTNASLMIEAGVNLKTVSYRLGHSELSTTFNIYIHAFDKSNILAAAKIEDVLYQNSD